MILIFYGADFEIFGDSQIYFFKGTVVSGRSLTIHTLQWTVLNSEIYVDHLVVPSPSNQVQIGNSTIISDSHESSINIETGNIGIHGGSIAVGNVFITLHQNVAGTRMHEI